MRTVQECDPTGIADMERDVFPLATLVYLVMPIKFLRLEVVLKERQENERLQDEDG